MSNQTESDRILFNNRVGPVVRSGDVAKAMAEAAVVDNPDKQVTVEANGAYTRIYTDGELIITRSTMEEELGRDFRMTELEVNLASFAGRIDVSDDHARFYYTTEL
ncbi:MAG: hypothetical protein RLZZ602_2446 [Pseudomonadota bacterium]|jgi:toluene monooxygenase system protein D